MKTIPALIIPHYNRADLTARCLNSIDHPVGQLVLILNGGPESCWDLIGHAARSKARLVDRLTVIHHPNAGVAGAWNEGIKLFPAPWWLIVNNDIQFAPGDLERMSAAVESTHAFSAHGPGIYYGNHGASWFALTADCVAQAGLFDENIYPAYLEDCDYARRCDLLGIIRANVDGCQAVHGEPVQPGSCTVNATPELAQKNCRTHGGNHEYYRAKWGGSNGQERYLTPFNEPHWPVDFWRFEPARRAAQQW